MDLLSLIITLVVGLVASFIAIWQARTQRVRQVEDVYVTRYWSLLDRLDPRTLRGLDGHDLSKEEELAIRLYFRLSEDQADLRAQSWVSDDTWREWKGAIHSQMSRSPFNRLWEETRQDSDEGRDYSFQHLREICRNADYDPRPKSRWRRLRHRA
ncbi:hypothetical protein AB0900_22875 [Streptomyces cellulosae]|uniref:hypothetical protein n=1 Tax=Streptomyces sp. McG7 TaxID=2725486 RepID=UPI001BE830FF|nr:hypothetical protein [Streptomyces sp. McG7]